MDKTNKAEFVQSFAARVNSSRLAVVADYQGINVKALTEFRKKLTTQDGEFQIVKNKLAALALAGTKFEKLSEFLKGPTAILLGQEDVVEAAKAITAFAKSNDKLSVKGAVLDGKSLTNDQLIALADLPSKEILQSMLLSVLQAPSRNLVSLLANVNRQILNVLVAYKDKLEESA